MQTKVVTFLKDKIGEYLYEFETGQDFLNQALTKMGNTDKLNSIKMKNSCLSKETMKRMKRQVTEWEKIFAIYVADKRFISGLYKEYIQIREKRGT